MHPNEELLRKFYTSFQKLDPEGIRSCYDREIRFSDPVFPYLKNEEVPSMWAMLFESLKKGKGDWEFTFSNIVADDVEGSCEWEAKYTFTLTGRLVHNKALSKFQFRAGKIVEQSDYFDFYRWSRMAFGVSGIFLGWTKFFKRKIQDGVSKRLSDWMARRVSNS